MRALLAALLVAATPGVHHTPAGTAAAHRALLRPADLGSTWTAASTPKKVGALTCGSAAQVKGAVEIGSAVGPTYRQSAAGPFLSQSVYVYDTSASAAAVFAHATAARVTSCLAQSLVAGDPNGKVAFRAGATQVLPSPHVGARTSAYRITGTAIVSAQKVRVFLDLVLVLRGNAIAAISYASFSAPVAGSVERQVASVAAARL